MWNIITEHLFMHWISLPAFCTKSKHYWLNPHKLSCGASPLQCYYLLLNIKVFSPFFAICHLFCQHSSSHSATHFYWLKKLPKWLLSLRHSWKSFSQFNALTPEFCLGLVVNPTLTHCDSWTPNIHPINKGSWKSTILLKHCAF